MSDKTTAVVLGVIVVVGLLVAFKGWEHVLLREQAASADCRERPR